MASPQSAIFSKTGALCRLAALARRLTGLARLEIRLCLVVDDMHELRSCRCAGSSTSIEGGSTPPIGAGKAQPRVRRLPASPFPKLRPVQTALVSSAGGQLGHGSPLVGGAPLPAASEPGPVLAESTTSSEPGACHEISVRQSRGPRLAKRRATRSYPTCASADRRIGHEETTGGAADCL